MEKDAEICEIKTVRILRQSSADLSLGYPVEEAIGMDLAGGLERPSQLPMLQLASASQTRLLAVL